MIHNYAGDVVAIDTFMHGWSGLTALYHLPGPEPILIETGPASSLQHIDEGLSEAEVQDVAWIVLTHIHLDHAGAVGHLARRFPAAKVVVRAEGAPHLVDPSRLWASASRLYPDMEKLWGEMLPVDESRIVAVHEDGPIVTGGGRVLEARYAPGHARHQMAIWDPDAGDLFTGDAIGVYLPEAAYIRPATPPPDFDLEVSVETIRALRDLGPQRVFPTHFGAVPDPASAFAEAEQRIVDWVAVADQMFHEGVEVSEVADAFRSKREEFYPGLSAQLAEKFDNTTSYELNAAGILRYLTKRSKA